ncbi:hypothetical protein J7384_05530 [Endozoicomonas sp. G2_1]|nr:hypothetical protein [Endozoicomonas sp. G2_1]MBO9489816.1 hypothetical protein [Endozoicomonas sp. G2_1]
MKLSKKVAALFAVTMMFGATATFASNSFSSAKDVVLSHHSDVHIPPR